MKKSGKKNLKQSKSGAKLKNAPDEKTLAAPIIETSVAGKLNPFLERVRQRAETSRKAALSRVIVQVS
jgi:hypothetical protein